MSYDSPDIDTRPPSPFVTDATLIERTRDAAFKLLTEPPCILDGDFLLDVIELGDRLQKAEAECFRLAAGVCEYRGGNEHGNPLCLKTSIPI